MSSISQPTTAGRAFSPPPRSARSASRESTSRFDAWRIANGERTKLQSWRLYALGALLGALVAGALGWYFDTAQVQVVIAKFWAYADVNYRARPGASSATSPPIRSSTNTAQINLGEVAGGVRLFWSESVAGRHQLVARGAAVLDQLCAARRAVAAQLAADPRSSQPQGRRRSGGARGAGVALGPLDGPDHQFIPAPVAGSQLVQSGRRDPHGRRDRRRRERRPRRRSAASASSCSWASRLRLAAHPHLVRPHGAEGRESRQPVVSGRRSGGRSGGAFRRPQWADARNSRWHPALRDLGAAADPLLHPARDRVGLGLDGGRKAGARRRSNARTGPHAGLAYGGAVAVFAAVSVAVFARAARQDRDACALARRRAAPNSPRPRSLSPSPTARSASRFSATAAAQPSSWARSAAAPASTSFAGRSIRCRRAAISSM